MTRIMEAMRSSLFKTALVSFRKLLLRCDHHYTIGGLDVAVGSSEESERKEAVAKLHEALRLVQVYAPVAFGRLHRDLKHIWVRKLYRIRGVFEPSLGTCSVDLGFLLDPLTTPGRLAMTVLHEGTHARLLRFGLTYHEAERSRIERLCVMSEIVFAKRMNAPKALLHEAHERLQRGPLFHTDEDSRQLAARRLAELGAPTWLVDRLARWSRPRDSKAPPRR